MPKAGKNKKRRPQAPKPSGPKCPGCLRKSHDQTDDFGNVWCENCRTFFDPCGDTECSHNDPVQAAIAKEERETRRKREARFGR